MNTAEPRKYEHGNTNNIFTKLSPYNVLSIGITSVNMNSG